LEIGLAQVRKIIAASAPDSSRDFAARITAVSDSLTGLLDKAERTLASTMTAYGQSRWRDEIRFKRDTETDMSALSRVVAGIYEPSWRGGTPAAQETAAKDETSPLGYGEIYVASGASLA